MALMHDLTWEKLEFDLAFNLMKVIRVKLNCRMHLLICIKKRRRFFVQ